MTDSSPPAPPAAGRVSIIIPILDEAACLRENLPHLQIFRQQGHEVIVVDGGSRDGSQDQAAGLVDKYLHSAPGRARQMNLGAAQAVGEWLWFLHIDTRVPRDAVRAILEAGQRHHWGRFDVTLQPSTPLLRIVAGMMNLRSRLTGIATGDQGIFVSRRAFADVDGFPSIALMEDVEMSRRLKRLGPPACLRRQVRTSSRRWHSKGCLRTILLMWWLRLAYFLGVGPERLARWYR